MEAKGFLFQAFIYLSAAVISVPVAKRLGLGSVLGYLLAGVLIGPFGLGFIGEEGHDVMHFAEFGVVMMLFLVGLELKPSLLWRLRVPIVGLGGLQVGLTAVALAIAGVMLALPWQTALAIGFALALSSTAIVLQSLNEKGLNRTDGGQGAFSVLLFQDIAVIPLLALLPLLALESTASESASTPVTWLDRLPAGVQTLVVLGVVGLVILVGRFLVRPVLRVIAATRLREIFTAAALMLVIGTALLMSAVGISPALGTFLAGVVLATSEYRHELESDVEPFKGLLLGVFFIAVGAGIDFELVAAAPFTILGLVALLIVIKFVVLVILGRAFRMGLDQSLLFAFALAQGGEFAFVLLSFATLHFVVELELANLATAVVAISMVMTPFLMLIHERFFQSRIGTREQVEHEPDRIVHESPVIIAGFGRVGSVVGRFLRANGLTPTVLEYDSDRVESLRKLGLKVFYGDATRYDLLRAAGADRAQLIVLAIDDEEKQVSAAETVRKHFPRLKILARASGRLQAYELLDAGVEDIFRETLDTSLRLGIEALRNLGFPGYEAHRSARRFRARDEDAVRRLKDLRHDQGEYVTEAKRQIQALEDAMLAELDKDLESRDEGWDTDSLRQEYGGNQ